MRSGVLIAALALAAVVAAVAFGGSDNGSNDDSDERAVIRVVKQGQKAIVSDRPTAVCRLLTRRARRNSLLLFNLGYRPDGTPRPKPKTCATAVGYMIDDDRDELSALRKGGEYYATEIVSISDRRAHVRKRDRTEIYLVKRNGRWLGDFASFAPFDGSSGY